jgi:predicted phage-related endonuclease
MSNKFHNRSTEDLADEFGNVKQQIEALEAKEKEIGEELKARIDDVPAVGHRWTVNKSVAKGRVTIDTKALKEALGEEIIKEYEKVGAPSARLLVKPTMILGESAAD